MNDLLRRLRKECAGCEGICEEAADEIEQLCEVIANICDWTDDLYPCSDANTEPVPCLKAAFEAIGRTPRSGQ